MWTPSEGRFRSYPNLLATWERWCSGLLLSVKVQWTIAEVLLCAFRACKVAFCVLFAMIHWSPPPPLAGSGDALSDGGPTRANPEAIDPNPTRGNNKIEVINDSCHACFPLSNPISHQNDGGVTSGRPCIGCHVIPRNNWLLLGGSTPFRRWAEFGYWTPRSICPRFPGPLPGWMDPPFTRLWWSAIFQQWGSSSDQRCFWAGRQF